MINTFKIFDSNNDGYIVKHELQALLGNIINEEMWKNILQEYDSNNDGKVILYFYKNSYFILRFLWTSLLIF